MVPSVGLSSTPPMIGFKVKNNRKKITDSRMLRLGGVCGAIRVILEYSEITILAVTYTPVPVVSLTWTCVEQNIQSPMQCGSRSTIFFTLIPPARFLLHA